MILGRDRHPAAHCFDEIDFAVEQVRNKQGKKAPVVFNAHAFPDEIPDGGIVYNFENAHQLGHAKLGIYAKDHDVWDFSRKTIDSFWQSQALYVPVGYHPSFERFKRSDSPDIDVVTYGLPNARRNYVTDELIAAGLRVCQIPAFTYGEDRDKVLARAKLVVSPMYYEGGVFPMLKAAHLVSNRVPCLFETTDDAPKYVMTAKYDRLVDLAVAMVGICKLQDHADRMYEKFRDVPMWLPK